MTGAPLLEIVWTDPVTGTRGFVVIDRLVRGLASGGLRIRKGCTLDEVAGLARGMSRKEALVYDPSDRYVPLGGAKGGLDLDPSSPDVRAVLTRFVEAIRPIVREQWTTGEDLGLRQSLLDEVAAGLGLRSTVEAVFAKLSDPEAARSRLRAAFAVEVDGIGLAELVGGYGVAQATIAVAERRRQDVSRLRAVVQGFGSIGGAAARYLERGGIGVVAVADREGLLVDGSVDGSGLEVEALLAVRDASGWIDRSRLPAAVDRRPGEEWLDVDADVLVPAATSYVLGPAEEPRVRASLVVEGANMPTVPAAEQALLARDVAVVPDFLANWATNAWWWWVVFGDIEPTAEGAFERIGTTMGRLVGAVVEEADAGAVSLRTAALTLADRNSAVLDRRFGIGGDVR